MANEFVVQRTAVAPLILTGSTAAFTQSSGVLIPAGAIITGIKIVAESAATKTNASQTVVPKVGTAAIGATLNVSDLPAETVCVPGTLAPTGGFVIVTGGELNVVGGATGTSTASGTWKYYVDYIYVND